MSQDEMNELKSLFAELQFNINSRFDAVDSRLDAVDRRLDAVDSRLDAVDSKLDTISKDIESINKITMFREVSDNIDRFAKQIVTH
jgi:tetrahydromethanopterin S-methyltransferase subunit G